MYTKSKFIFVFLALLSSISAKDFNFGLRIEFFTYKLEKVRNGSSYSSETSFSELPSIYLFYKHHLNENISILIKPGFFFSGNGEFNGIDIGSYLSLNFSNNRFYLFSGINLLSLSNAGGGSSPPEFESAPYLLSLGVGYYVNKHISLDLGYYHNLKKRIGTSYLEFNKGEVKGLPLNLQNLIKLSLEVNI